jgi:hypothetical protein
VGERGEKWPKYCMHMLIKKKPMGYSKGNPKRKVYSHECVSLKHRKISNEHPNTTSQTPRKTRTSKTQNK